MKILFTGGLGYIGSHTAVEVLKAGHDVVIIDDLSNSKIGVLDKIQQITQKEVKFYKINICDKKALEKVFAENMMQLRKYEETLKNAEETALLENANSIKQCVADIVRRIQG